MLSRNSTGTDASWITVSFAIRSIFTLAIPLVINLQDRLSLELILLTSGWFLIALFIILVRYAGEFGAGSAPTLALFDLAFATAVIALTGYYRSPLQWTLALGPLTIGLQRGRGAAIRWGLLGVGSLALVLIVFNQPTTWEILSTLALLIIIIPTTFLFTIIGLHIRRTIDDQIQSRLADSETVRQEERGRAYDLFNMATAINASLDVETVVKLSLDLCTKALHGSGARDGRIGSALLLLTPQGFRIMATRNLPAQDHEMVFSKEAGALSRALVRGGTQTALYPESDPELRQINGLDANSEVLITPLAYGFDTFGALLFGHPEPRFFDPVRRELLTAIGQQVTIALQNARLYENLLVEKERISELQEESRKKLARDLHDGPIQTLAAITMRLNYARRLMDRDMKDAREELVTLETVARQTTREIRHMLFTMRPLILESQGLVAALFQLAEKVRETHHANVVMEVNQELSSTLDAARQGVIFYIAEEAVNNARKHAQASHIWLRLWDTEDEFMLQVEDDGVGFNVGAVDANYEQLGSMGMVTMRERAELVDAALRVESSEGEGTCLTLRVPKPA
ncbi:MAG: GAF domain-containing sensor histidine kinase [Anaerolineales bacterium]|jgi:signal transduction histidine kinase